MLCPSSTNLVSIKQVVTSNDNLLEVESIESNKTVSWKTVFQVSQMKETEENYRGQTSISQKINFEKFSCTRILE